MKTTSRFVAIYLLAFSSFAQAEFYFGGNYGLSQIEYEKVKDGSAYKAFVGYIFANNFAVDIALLDSGEMDIDPENTVFEDDSLYMQFQGMSYSAAYYLRPTEEANWYMSAKVGVYDIETKGKIRNTGEQITESTMGLGWGIGIGYLLFNHISLGFDVDGYYGVEDFADKKTLTIVTGRLAFHF
ncbi:MAG: hypothetical protein AMJ53_11425 [Gammaproteobacteria bacterium SG8_11]|nr:MAG: hypothetical protein AMJ53_11425 [Gammaproteobacteria bacterium SG8_11]